MYKIYEQFIAYAENILMFHKTAGTDILNMLFEMMFIGYFAIL